ncbi:MAG: EscU/YscU/HrcU family type III secretion system export apparatus switch protein [Myxococcota bacterium]|nr:EscU/YscU/HrcU family type III secretion system export apparatus switch protein [Myxococcota bacterium]
MSEENQDKPLPASAKKRAKAKEDGQFARSPDVNTIGVLLMGMTAFAVFFDLAQNSILKLFQYIFGTLDKGLNADLYVMVQETYVLSSMPTMLACCFGGLALAYVQTGGEISFSGLKFKPEGLNPFTGLKKVFMSMDALQEVGLAILKVTGVGAICVHTVYSKLPELLTKEPWSLIAIGHSGVDLLLSLLFKVAIAMVIFGIIDWIVKWRRNEKQLRMDHKDMKDETKEQMGDPEIRSKRFAKHYEILQQAMQNVASADVVVVNPTHFAVALTYNREKMGAPQVVAKGVDHLAARIRAIARQNGVPIVSQPPLARLLYRRVRTGREVPADLFQAVALVLAYVYRLRRRSA